LIIYFQACAHELSISSAELFHAYNRIGKDHTLLTSYAARWQQHHAAPPHLYYCTHVLLALASPGSQNSEDFFPSPLWCHDGVSAPGELASPERRFGNQKGRKEKITATGGLG
jgi:hypothetical protein